MSVIIVKRLSVVEAEPGDWGLKIHGAANNVRPYIWHTWVTSSQLFIPARRLTKRRAEMKAVGAYEDGNFHGGANRYSLAYLMLLQAEAERDCRWRWREMPADISHWCQADRDKPENAPDFLLDRVVNEDVVACFLDKADEVIAERRKGDVYRQLKHLAEWPAYW